MITGLKCHRLILVETAGQAGTTLDKYSQYYNIILIFKEALNHQLLVCRKARRFA